MIAVLLVVIGYTLIMVGFGYLFGGAAKLGGPDEIIPADVLATMEAKRLRVIVAQSTHHLVGADDHRAERRRTERRINHRSHIMKTLVIATFALLSLAAPAAARAQQPQPRLGDMPAWAAPHRGDFSTPLNPSQGHHYNPKTDPFLIPQAPIQGLRPGIQLAPLTAPPTRGGVCVHSSRRVCD